MTSSIVSLEQIRAAAARASGVVRRTPILDVFDDGGTPFALKCENMQVTGSFKFRGAFNLLAQLDADVRHRGVIAYSSGNHGQAVAYAARRLGIGATVVMPEQASRVKVQGTRRWGADVIFEGATSADRQVRAEAEAGARGLTLVPPCDHPDIIAGAGTTGLEILDDRPDVSVIYVPMGGGGQISGVAAAVKALRPDVRIVGVEPAGAARMSVSLSAGHPVSLERTASVADGLLTLRPGDLTFVHVQALVDAVVSVTDEEIVRAVRWLFQEGRVVAEPSGAAAVAAVLAQEAPASVGTVAIVSGGNVAPDQYAALITDAGR